jgi:hypothetical protein
MNAVDIRPVGTPARALQRFDRSDPFDAIMAAVNADGAAIVERFVTPGLLARLNAELDEPIRQKPPGSRDVGEAMGVFWGQQTKRFTRLAASRPPSRS